jgi:hypothetical protein
MSSNYPHVTDCYACGGGRVVSQSPAGHGTPRVEYRCEDCKRAGFIRARDNRRLGPVFEPKPLSDALLAYNDVLLDAEATEASGA